MAENSKDPFYQRWWFILLIIILAVGVIENLVDDSKQAKRERADAIALAFKEEAVKEEKVENQLPPDVIAARLLKNKFGSTREERDNAVVSAEYENGVVEVIISAEKVTSTKAFKHSSYASAVDFLEAMQSQPNVNQATLIVQAPLTDRFGDIAIGDVMIVIMSKETLDKINFQNFKADNLSVVADDYWEHPALSAK